MLKFAENLKFYRKSIAVTQSKFADILNEKLSEMGLGIDYNNKSVSMWEKGDRFPDSPLVWIALAEIMGVSLDEMMTGDMSTKSSVVAEVACDVNNELQVELCESYLRSVCEGDFKNIDIRHIYNSIDDHIEGNLYHGMFFVLSSVKSSKGYFSKYNIEDVHKTTKYINGLSKVEFCPERVFVRNIIDNGGRDVVVTNDQIGKIWEGYLECLGNIEDYNTISMYDMDKNHIVTIVEYNIHIDRESFINALGLNANNFNKTINNIILTNKKFHLGIRWAKEIIKK